MPLLFKAFKDKKGSAIIETAIMLIVIMALTIGYLYFIQAIRINTVLQVAAREGARTYAITDSPSKARAKAEEELRIGGIDPKYVTITTKSVGSERQVFVSLRRKTRVPFAGIYNYLLQGAASYRRERSD